MKKKTVLVYQSSETSNIKEIPLSFPTILLTVLTLLILSVIILKYSIDFVVDFTQNSKIAQLKKENHLLQNELAKIDNTISVLRENINHLENKDDQIRTILDLPAINAEVRQVGIGGTDIGSKNRDQLRDLAVGDKLIKNLETLDRLQREIRLEKASYERLLTTVERRQDSIRYLPAIKPVHHAYLSSGFGNRFHPILHKYHFHKGVDLATNRGTPVFATADGYVIYAGYNGGFGKMVKINHKYGFETYYGHLNKIYVRKGQFVKRGEKIGEVGSTGLATSSHLHYEVHYKGNPINPLKFFLNDSQF